MSLLFFCIIFVTVILSITAESIKQRCINKSSRNMKRITALCFAFVLLCTGVYAQRKMDNLGRGLVAVSLADNGSDAGTLISWRRLGTEYYDVTYNLYYNGSRLATELTNTNFIHKHSITGSEKYQVAAVVKGVEQTKCGEVTVWQGHHTYKVGSTNYVGGYMDIHLGEIFSRGGTNVTNDYTANDIEVADLDGDGELEFIVKRQNTADANALYVDMQDPAYDVLEAYEFDGTLLWWIDVGANMVSVNATETNVIAFDWDQDGAAEVVLRGADDMVIHYKENGQWKTQNIGIYGLSTRNQVYHAANGTFTNSGSEYLLYLNGATGKPYNIGNNNESYITYPLPRLEQGETDVADAWWYSAQYTGTGKNGIPGHRDSKYFMGAPYLDGRKPSLFLGRGIYNRHKMIAMDVNPNTHKWTTRWTWNCNDRNSPWFGNGFHNFLIADVDEDGRDEIVYGSMVIDANGKGLSTTGYQHGDAQHVSDFNPWRKGLEYFGCLEDAPYYGSNYRDATTGEVLYKFTSTGDDGRALMANFSNSYPGCYGRSAAGPEFSSVTGQLISGLSETLNAGKLNFRIYWDGDLLSEWQDAAGTRDGYITIDKPGIGRIFNSSDSRKENDNTIYYNSAISNNDTKHNTCFQGDIIGDWREEIIARVDARTVRLFTTGNYSEYSLPTLWHDHQYRQAMGTQEMVYNLPPHLSFFLGEMEGYTQAPPPQMTNERTVITNGSSINSSMNGKQVMVCETGNMTIKVETGASPWVFTDNAPSMVEGTDNNGTSGTKVRTDGTVGVSNPPAINCTYYTHTVTGSAFTGYMHLTKQGDGTLVLPNVTQTYTGNTTVWAGTLVFDGTMQSSPVCMKRFTTLNTSGGSFSGGMTMQYGATLNVGGANANTLSSVTVSDLTLEYGARVVLDVNGSGENEHDWLNATTLNIDDSKVDDAVWKNYGPEFIAPVFEIRTGHELAEGDYPIGNVANCTGNLSTVVFECSSMNNEFFSLIHMGGILYLRVDKTPKANEASIVFTGMAPYQQAASVFPSASVGNYYLPVVSITGNESGGNTPTLSGYFTSAIDGSVTTITGNLSSYTFTEPGTLSVRSQVAGYKPSEAIFDVPCPYYKQYESPDYNSITAANASTALGSELWYWNSDNSHVDARGWERFANWAKITYTFAINQVNSNAQTMWIDKDNTLWVDFTNSQQALHLLEGYGVGQSGGSTFHAANLGDENTIIYHRYYTGYGHSTSTMEEYTHPTADGTYTYGRTDYTLQKFIVYVPVSIQDEPSSGVTTAISTASEPVNNEQKMYNLQGQLLNQRNHLLLKRGVYIVNGKKVIVK